MFKVLRRSGLLEVCLLGLSPALFFAVLASEWLPFIGLFAGVIIAVLFLSGKI